jgi:hypothetical protein
MELPKEKTKPKKDPSKLRWLFYSEPKTGKTTLAAGFNDPLFIITEQSTESIFAYSVECKKWEDFKDIVNLLLDKKHTFKTVVVDVVDVLYRQCIVYCNAKLKIEHISEAGYARGYHLVDNEFEHWLNKLEMSGLGLIFTSHISEKEVQSKNGAFTKIVPGLAPRGRTVLEPKVSAIGYLKWEKIKKLNSPKLEYEQKLVIDFRQTESLLVGDRTGKMPDKLVLHTIPEGTVKTDKMVEEYAKKNYELIQSYFTEEGK